jgi:hypothetical protein
MFDQSGYLSNDSTNYLHLASNLVDGNGLYVVSETGEEGSRTLFSSWPVGYPSLIAAISILIDTSVFISSKILNIIFIGLTLLFFRKLFSYDAWIYALIFLFSSYLEIYSFTWSETGFIFALVMFVYYLHKFLNNKGSIYYSALMILFSACFLFVIRYIGAYTVGVLGLVWIYLIFYNGGIDKRKITILSAVIFINILAVVAYLYFNYIETGMLSGRERVLSPESNYELAVTLAMALLSEIAIPVYHPRLSFIVPSLLFQFLIVSYFVYKNKAEKTSVVKEQRKMSISKLFFITGVLYLLCLIVTRWIFYFNEYSFRLLGPGTFLIFVSLISYSKDHLSDKSFGDFKKTIGVLTLISFLLYVPIKTYFRFQQSYAETINQLNQKYSHIPEGSVLSFEGNKHLKYYRSDLIIKKPLVTESIYDFYNRVNTTKHKQVFLEVPKNGRLQRYDKSFSELLSGKPAGSIIEVK